MGYYPFRDVVKVEILPLNSDKMSQEEELLEILHKVNDEYDEKCDVFFVESDGDFRKYQELLKPYSKKCSEASRNYRFIQTPEFTDDVPDYGDVMSLKKFISCCEEGGFIDYDGFGEYIKDGKTSGITIHASDVKYKKVRTDFTEMVWFNR